MRKLKLYVDTSVWNFYFADDAPEKRDVTKDFFDLVRKGEYEVFISEVVLKEISDASELKKTQLGKLIKSYPVIELEITEEAVEMAKSYMAKGILPEKKEDDALHVAIATAAEMDAVVTWNYQHLANLRKAELFHSASLEKGYFKKLEIVTPMEVSRYES
ncbi:MAG: type II toxin-antitoxin system VapC family toxin [bacterium]